MNTNFLKKITAGLTDLSAHDDLLPHIAIASPTGKHPVVQHFQTAIEHDPLLRMLLTESIAQAQTSENDVAYTDRSELYDYLNAVVQLPTPWSNGEAVGGPLLALLQPILLTPSGYQLFRSERFNQSIKLLLQAWYDFLNSEASCRYLHAEEPMGWFCPTANEQVKIEEFISHPTRPYYGFISWNAFFTRQFKPGMRPVKQPDNDNALVASCEAIPFCRREHLRATANFWIKDQPYSLNDLFGQRAAKYTADFTGGTLLQSFLAGYLYHRWHAPVAGEVVDIYSVAGTYFSAAESVGNAGMTGSQPYLTALATRMLVIIKCDNSALGKIALVYVGMAEVSSCVATVNIGTRVEKGDELGYFQYGGSSYCILTEKNVAVKYNVRTQEQDGVEEVVRLNEVIGSI